MINRIDAMLHEKENLESEFRMKLLMFAIRYSIEEMTIGGELIVNKVKQHPMSNVGDRTYQFDLDIDIKDYRMPDDFDELK